MVVESSSMASNFGEDEGVVGVELELCLSLGGPFKKTEKSKPIDSRTDGQSNDVTCTKDIGVDLNGETEKKREISVTGVERECKRIRTECNGIVSGVNNGVNLNLSFSEMGKGLGQRRENSKDVTIESPSSDVSDPSSSSRLEGGSCDFGAQSGQTKLARPPVNNVQIGTEEAVRSTVESNIKSVARETGKPPKPHPNGTLLPFAQMPCVTSTGNGPEGKTVNGFLYRYSKSEISIICVCHGTSFSPAEFIAHAGGTNVSHPLRHITVVPSTF